MHTLKEPSPWFQVQMSADAVYPFVVQVFRSDNNGTGFDGTQVWLKDTPFDCADPTEPGTPDAPVAQ